MPTAIVSQPLTPRSKPHWLKYIYTKSNEINAVKEIQGSRSMIHRHHHWRYRHSNRDRKRSGRKRRWLHTSSYCYPVKVRKGIPSGLNRRIEAVELSIFDFQAPLLSKTPSWTPNITGFSRVPFYKQCPSMSKSAVRWNKRLFFRWKTFIGQQ